MEDVGVEHAERIVEQRMGHPGDVPDRVLAVARRLQFVAEGSQVESEGVGEGDGQDGKAGHHEGEFQAFGTADVTRRSPFTYNGRA